ncbi:MAG: TldD/PmbA family protein [Bacteroidales bacterium]|nr:TldD/PmbA family protein [Bacteroidales bacterium]
MYNKYLELFGVTEEDLKKLINIALEEGGDYADLYFEHSIANELALRDSEVNAVGSHIDYGVGIRVVSGDQTGYAYSEITTMPKMVEAARTAAKIATGSTARFSAPQNVTLLEGNNFYPIARGWDETSVTHKIPYLKKLNDIAFSLDKRVTKVSARISDSLTKVLFFNSLGETYADLRPMVSVVCSCVMEDNGKLENGSASRSFRMGFELLDDRLIEDLAKEAVTKTSFLFGAKQPKGGEMAVVMGSGSSGILLHEAVGHAFEADFNRKQTSIFSDKMGKQVCDKSINIIDDGTITANRGAVNYDDEGVPGQKTYLVKDGILNSYLHDRISARYYKTSPTGNGRRESFRYMPIPRMRATYMEGGNTTEEQMISSVKYGIYANNFTNGQVQIGAGDFTFFVKSGYLIENGKLTQPIKDINIIGNGPQALKDIVAVANNNRIDNSTWTCGKEQYCAVSCGMPSVLVNRLTVGGCN